jgi:hypothetical protein
MAAPAVRKAEDVSKAKDAEALIDTASLIEGLADVVQEQIDEYTSLLEDVVEKATGRSLWAPCSLADAGGDHQTLNRKSGAISYLLIAIGEKAAALQLQARKLLPPSSARAVPTPIRKPRAQIAKRRAA